METCITAFCNTLLHSLWIGCIAALLAWVLLASLREATPRLRYNMLCVILFLFVTAVAIIGYTEFSSLDAIASAVNGEALVPSSFPAVFSKIIPEKAGILSLAAIINRYSGLLFAIWAFFFLFKSIRLAAGLSAIQRLRTKEVFAVEGAWLEKIEEISAQLGIYRTVALLQSAKVRTPVAVGFLKPVILIPAGMLLQMPTAQVEAVLWHELAHVCRRDYFVNLLQELLEAILFFNPAVLWLSALIREEREMCCDDLVLANIPQKSHYFQALLSFPIPITDPNFAMGLAFRPNQLKSRLQRMLGTERQRFKLPAAGFLAAGLMLVLTFFVMEIKPVTVQKAALIVKEAAQSNEVASLPDQELLPEITTAQVISPRIVQKSTPPRKREIAKNYGELSPQADADRVRAVLAELVSTGIVGDTEAIEWFGLSDTELVVNGVAQPPALQQEFEKRFAVQPGYGLYYGPVQITGKGFFVDKQELAAL